MGVSKLNPKSNGGIEPPFILSYSSYRAFLKDFYEYKRSLKSGFSYRRFSSLVGLKSPNYLQLVIQDKRNLTPETGERVADVLKLSRKEKDYFIALIHLENAKNDQEKEEATQLKCIAAKRLATHFVPEAQIEVLSDWCHLLIRELVLFADFEPSGVYISEKLGGIVDPIKAEASLRYLIQAGFIQKNSEGKFVMIDPALSTGADVFLHENLQNLHKQVLTMWANNLEKLSPKEQELHYLNIPMREDKIPELKKRIAAFQEELIGWLQDEKEPDRIVQLGTYLMPFPKTET